MVDPCSVSDAAFLGGFVGTCNSCIRFRTCARAANGGPCSREDRTTPTQGPDTSSQESTSRTEREEIVSLTLTQDAEAEARVAELVEETTTSDLGQDDEIEHRTDSALTARGNDQRADVIATVSETMPDARGAAADEMATQAAEVDIEASQLAAEMAEATAGQTASTDLGAANSL
jgi:hypothetical protein